MTENMIGLDKEKSKKISEKLNKLLANYQLFYMNTRGFHWNVQGPQFFELHAKFEEIYNDLLIKVDEIAERILTLGESPVHAYSIYLGQAEVKEAINITDGKMCVRSIIEGYGVVIRLQRELLTCAADSDDEGTVALVSGYITEQEKQLWMLSAYLS
ncbi:DNA protection during starvation protein [Piscirickettsia salmonis]|uniref:Dps family protein n=1 Tax=Piscirickettsia salmonis TaxID=1238 RepID=UPI0012B9D5C9|nr:Dps family protein [Piscirickettsia salmonis]QGP49153.1 DNA protection during starvation protein [Piscirickettsia salmonis]QGP56061.1 DNA protection during starvation protein [Piscirickettsia salmonis]QGP58068.1 DNA protection during starvation protein [Piscirickettsia salmonis]QGP65631.1 DNA protection during starvation protein [Piscirickettsia salmonis]